ncbi:hypothetical protein GCM10009665_16060 [Kitasatospora nipponensis]|uniref:Uncharacterized protein n=1 Tax=Kitasatospora nipponensis TaxID=258049 RepID=A0ABN1W0B9_9ACTN
MPCQDHDPQSALLQSVVDTLRTAGFPLTAGGDVSDGVVVSCASHGVTVSWRGGTRGGRPAPEAPARATSGRVPVHGGAAVRSEDFRLTLRLATMLAEAGYQSDHLGDHVLVSGADRTLKDPALRG